ncbi:hypothetical protein FTUN_2951 [Frigoriglobus tundricola]|uniref:TraD/TraG TraM recognition site domain-containing protein n=1 Tax=Frigoriglobus tundricola TaxID=2774151 RepID=A0A6M5YQY5_9BACT|nr:hypothetical protein FTUN_2951 [Frigoriglobus tundricola]
MLDPKAEMYLQFRAAREALGRDVYCIDPYGIARPDGGHTYNPMIRVSADDPFLIDIAKDMAASLVTRTGEEKERFFPDASEHLIQTVISAVLWGGEPVDRHLATVADIIASPELLANTLAAIQHTDAYGGALRTLGRQAAQLEGREKASVLSSIAAQYLGWLNSAPVRDTIRTSTVDPMWLKTRNADLFVCIPPERLRSANGYVRYLLNGILRRLVEGPPDESRPVMVILDEVSLIGRLNILEEAVTLFAGWGVVTAYIWQSLGQVQDLFPGDKAKTFLANNSLQIFGKTNDLETAKHISERIGDTTVLGTSVQNGESTSYPTGVESRQGSGQRSTSWSVTHNEMGRRLIRPEEVLALPAEVMTVFTDRTRPILVRQVRFYSPEFWHTEQGGKTTFGHLAVAVLCIWALVIAGLLSQPAPIPTSTPYTPNRDSGRPVGGNPSRPTRGPNDEQEDRRGPRPGHVQKRSR